MPTAVKKVVTKTTPKVVAKKVAVKPKKVVAKKDVAGKSLVYADSAKSFWLKDGQILNSLQALHDALVKMDKVVYAHHVGKGKNDFAEWVQAVLGDKTCATDLRKAKSAGGAKLVVAKYLKEYRL